MKRYIIILLSLMCAPLLHANEPVIKNWDVSHTKDWVRLTTHGKEVYGHRFGLLKSTNACRYDMLYMTLSTYDKSIESVNIDEVVIEFKSGSDAFTLPVPYLGSSHLFGSVYGITFSNMLMTERFIGLIEKNDGISIQITSPLALKAKLDVTAEHFDLRGFSKAYDQAATICLQLKNP